MPIENFTRGETCPICGREGCFKPFSTTETCDRLGYSRSQEALAAANARAEKAEADVRYEANRSDLYAAEVSRLEKELAAARRECDALRTMVEKCRAWFVLDDSALGLMEWDMADQCTAALAVPAAGPDEDELHDDGLMDSDPSEPSGEENP